MEVLLDLDVEFADTPIPLTGHDAFSALARQEGLEIVRIRLSGSAGGSFALDELLEQIDSSRAFWIRSPHLLTNPKIAAGIEKRLEEGAIALARVDWQSAPGVEWFEPIGIEPLSIRAVRSISATDARHPMLIPIERDKYEIGFRDSRLFRGVERLLLQQLNGIGVFGEAKSVLSVPSSEIRLVDSRSDLSPFGVPRPELNAMVSSGLAQWRGRVIAYNAGFFHDRYVGPFGAEFPGIEGYDNKVLAKNLLRELSEARSSASARDWGNVNSIISEIEHKIFEITNRTLMLAFGDQWFELRVPIKIREKCHLRKDLEASGFPVASYLDFADYRAIWKFNWENFLPYLRLAHADPSRGKSLEFIQQILPIRNLASHTTKRIALGLTRPTIDQVKVLEAARDQLRQMLK